jgi:hypothetical protein
MTRIRSKILYLRVAVAYKNIFFKNSERILVLVLRIYIHEILNILDVHDMAIMHFNVCGNLVILKIFTKGSV